jgi:hypothetical protein
MKQFKDLAPKPSDALQAMVNGLRHQSQRPDFIIKMTTYGDTELDVETGHVFCCGCAATCTLQELGRHNYTPEEMYDTEGRATPLGIERRDLDRFESAIDTARLGSLWDLFVYYYGDDVDVPEELLRIPATIVATGDETIYLQTHNWQEQLPDVEAHIARLRAAGY